MWVLREKSEKYTFFKFKMYLNFPMGQHVKCLRFEGFHGGDYEECGLLRFYAMWLL
jgi:hypothetical protein